MKLRVGDEVKIISGRDRGKKGKVERLFPKEGKVAVSGVNRFKKHLKPSTRLPKGGIVDIARPLKDAKVMVVCPHCSQLTRVGLKIVSENKIRVCKHCGKSLDAGKKK